MRCYLAANIHVCILRSPGGVPQYGGRQTCKEMPVTVHIKIPQPWDMPEHQITPSDFR